MTQPRNDDDLEGLLRATLATAGDTITSGPSWNSGETYELLPALPQRRWIAPVAAAAAAAVVAGVVFASRQAHEDKTPPGTPSPSITTSTPTPTPTPTRRHVDVERAACSVPLPTAWASALSKGTTPADAGDLDPLAVFPDGRLVVARHLGAARDVALLGADGHANSIFTVTDPQVDQVLAAQVESNTVLIEVSRNVNDPAVGVRPTVIDLVLIDPGLGRVNVASTRKERPGRAEPLHRRRRHARRPRLLRRAQHGGRSDGHDLRLRHREVRSRAVPPTPCSRARWERLGCSAPA